MSYANRGCVTQPVHLMGPRAGRGGIVAASAGCPTVGSMRKVLPFLLLVSLAACSSTAATDPSSDSSTVVPTSNPSPTTGPAKQDQSQTQSSPVTIPQVTEVPSDLKSGEGRQLIADETSVFGVNQFAVAFANGVVYTVSRYLGGEPIDMAALLTGAEYQESAIPVVPNIDNRTFTQIGDTGIEVKGELNNTPTPSFSVAYVCLLNGGAYTSLSACAGS